MAKEFAGINNNRSIVFYCFDCDDYDCNQRDSMFLAEVEKYCRDNGYEHIWFCKDIERVCIGEKVPDKLKKQKAADFRSKNILNVKPYYLTQKRIISLQLMLLVANLFLHIFGFCNIVIAVFVVTVLLVAYSAYSIYEAFAGTEQIEDEVLIICKVLDVTP